MDGVFPTPGARQPGTLATLAANLDLCVLLCLLMADVRVFNGSAVASFTLFELFVWGYCAPVVVSYVWIQGRSLPARCLGFMVPLGLYMAWLLAVSGLAIVFRSDTEVLQNTKNIIPALVLVAFLFIRIRDIKPVILLCNMYVIYAVLSCVVAFCQFKFGAPYFRELIVGTEYKLDISGDTIGSPIVGFTGHPNAFAMAILPAVALAVLKLHAEIRNGWRVRPITIAVAALLCAGMALSQARGATVFTLAAIAFFVSPLGRTRQFPIKFAWVAGLIACIVVYGFHEMRSGEAPGAATIETRVLLWQTSFDAMASDAYVFLFGDGVKFVSQWSWKISGWEFPDAHNGWIDQMLFFGVPAVVLYLSIWWRFYSIVEAPAAHRPATDRILLDAIRVTVMALMGDYFFEPVANVVFPVSQLFLFMALAVRVASFSAVAGAPAIEPSPTLRSIPATPLVRPR